MLKKSNIAAIVLGALPFWHAAAQNYELRSVPPPFVPANVKCEAAKEEAVQLTAFENGVFRRGAKALQWAASRPLYASLREECQFDISFYPKTSYGWLDAVNFNGDSGPDKMSGRAEFPLTKDKDTLKGAIEQTARLAGDGRVEIQMSYSVSADGAKDFKGMGSVLKFPKSAAGGKKIKLGEPLISLPSASDWGTDPQMWIPVGGDAKAKEIVFDPENVESSFKIIFPSAAHAVAFRHKDGLRIHLNGPSSATASGELRMILDFGKASAAKKPGDSIVAGINFTQCDNFEAPLFTGSANMLINPGFASGLRYWRSIHNGAFMRPGEDESLTVCAETPFGNKALQLGKNHCGGIGSLGIPIYPDKPYVFSFYAKPAGTGKASADLTVMTYASDARRAGDSFQRKNYPLNPGVWTRCSHNVKLPHSEVRFAVGGDGLFVGGFQFEEGSVPGAYCGNAFGMELLTDGPDGAVSDASKPMNPRLKICGPGSADGSVFVSATDFFGRSIYKKELSFKIGADGETVLALPLDAVTPLGVTVLRAELKPSNAPSYIDHFRIIRMKYVGNDHKNSRLQSMARYGFNVKLASLPDSDIDIFRKAGGGQFTYYWGAIPTGEDFARLKKFGFDGLTNINLLGQISLRKGLRGDNCVLQGTPIHDIEKVTDKQLEELEEYAFQTAKALPFVKSWYSVNEPFWASLQKGNYEDFAKLEIALFKGVKRANPAAEFISEASCNMGEEGIRSEELIFAAWNKLAPGLKADAASIHGYTPFPEQPDLESQLLKFFETLKQQGFGDRHPVNINEGAYYLVPLNVPAWNIAPWSGGGDKYLWMASPSYDMGWAERASAAMTLRSWLVYYKHMDRVKCATPWGMWFLDTRTPYAWIAMSSALGDVLGDSVFKRDIRFAPRTRAYVFEDGKGRPVAAVWCFSEALEKGQETPPSIDIDLKGVSPEFIDMMGNICKAPREGSKQVLPVSTFPFYIRGKAGELDSLCAALQNAAVSGDGFLPLEISMRPASRDGAKAEFVNMLTKNFEGTVQINNGGKKELSLLPKASAAETIPLKGGIPADRIGSFDVPVSVTPKGGKEARINFVFRAFAVNYVKPGLIKADGDLADWSGIPQSVLENHRIGDTVSQLNKAERGDFTVSFRAAWNEQSLYMLFEITDSAFAVDHSNPKPSSWYKQNSIQLMFDALGDGKMKASRNSLGYDENDFSYELLPMEDGKSAAVYRRLAPDQQLTGGLNGLKDNVLEPEVKIAFRHDGNRQIYEAEFPARYLMPMCLSEGEVSGLGIKVFNHNGSQTVTNTEAGKEVFRRPDNYPQMLLVK